MEAKGDAKRLAFEEGVHEDEPELLFRGGKEDIKAYRLFKINPPFPEIYNQLSLKSTISYLHNQILSHCVVILFEINFELSS